MTVTFINALRVPHEREAEFIETWDRGAAYIRGCAGLIETSLHRSLNPQSPYQFFTVAKWESAEHFAGATNTDWWRQYVSEFGFGDGPNDFGAVPTLCEPVRE